LSTRSLRVGIFFVDYKITIFQLIQLMRFCRQDLLGRNSYFRKVDDPLSNLIFYRRTELTPKKIITLDKAPILQNLFRWWVV
jgi:hypothetical protein